MPVDKTLRKGMYLTGGPPASLYDEEVRRAHAEAVLKEAGPLPMPAEFAERETIIREIEKKLQELRAKVAAFRAGEKP